MKHLHHLLLIALVALSVRCSEEEPATSETNIVFSFDVATSSLQTPASPSAQALVVTVLNEQNEPALLQHRIDFHQDGSVYKTSALNLPPGRYTLAEFALVDEASSEIRYAVASNSGITEAFPLNIPFSVPSTSPDIRVELEPVSNRQSEEFGYSSFKLSRNRIAVTVHTSDQSKPQTAEAFIIQRGDTVDHYQLKASVNHLAVHGDADEIYTLSIRKDGYQPSSHEVRIHEVSNAPLKIVLKKESAFFMLAYVDGSTGYNDFQIDLMAAEGAINISWGDGSDTEYAFDGERAFLYHEYAETGNYPVKITGDLDKIIFFYSYYGQGQIDSVDFSSLTAIEEIRFGLSRSPKVLDLTQNGTLTHLQLSNLTRLEKLLLPAEHNIEGIMIDGPNNMSGEAVDAVIDNIYANTTRSKISQGVFGLAAEWYQMEDDERLVGPPSEESLTKLKVLKEAYGWYIAPDPF